MVAVPLCRRRPPLLLLLLVLAAAAHRRLPQESLFQEQLLLDVEEQIRSGVR